MIYFVYFLLISISIVPFYNSADKAANQWLVLGIVNIFWLLILFFKRKEINFSILRHPLFLIYSIFYFFILASLFYTNNIILSLHDIGRHTVFYLLLTSLILSFRLFNIKYYFIFLFFSILLLIESVTALLPIIFDYYNGNIPNFKYDSININALVGLTGNRNITTAAIVVKLPFLLFFFIKAKNYLHVSLLSLLLFFPISVLFLISSRAALLSFIFIVFLVCLFELKAKPNRLRIYRLILTLSIITLSFFISKAILPHQTNDSLEKVSSIRFSNESSSNRLELWNNAIDYISSNPIFGAGIGNWKIESAAYWGSLGDSYLVPYHAHNDFLEITTELGILGGALYGFIFLFSLYFLFKIFKKDQFLSFILFISILSYCIDSFFNFPMERPIMQIPLLFILSLIVYKSYKSHA